MADLLGVGGGSGKPSIEVQIILAMDARVKPGQARA
jgi:hypothetical protein